MLFVTVAINYLDRSNLSVAAPGLARELQLNSKELGVVFSGFGYAYALCQIPGGWLVDRVRPRILFSIACGCWSLATLLQGAASSFLGLIGLRLVLGIFEAPSFPICTRLASTWFPERERAGVIGFYTSGQYVGLAFLTPVLIYAQERLGWRSTFYITGALGLAWAAFWFLYYRDPWRTNRLSPAERDYIQAGGGWVTAPPASARARGVDWADLRLALTQRSLWGLYIGQFALNAIPWFFLTWFPTYLATSRHLDLGASRLTSALPFLAAFLGVLSGGLVSDLMARRGVSATIARKAPIIAGMLLSTCVVGANFVSDRNWMIFFLALAFFGNGFASITWVLVSLIAPQRLLGLTGGIFNFFGNMASVVVPTVVGLIVSHHGFEPALVFVSAIALGGALSYIFLVGPVARIPDDVAAAR